MSDYPAAFSLVLADGPPFLLPWEVTTAEGCPMLAFFARWEPRTYAYRYFTLVEFVLPTFRKNAKGWGATEIASAMLITEKTFQKGIGCE